MVNQEDIKWFCESYDELSRDTLYKILQARQQIFIVEQECAYLDADGKDPYCYHFYAMHNDHIVAYARLLPPKLSYEEASIGRVLVMPEYRSYHVGRILMEKAMESVVKIYQVDKIRISAQAYLERFYHSLGFQQESEIYLEDNIPHIEMLWQQ